MLVADAVLLPGTSMKIQLTTDTKYVYQYTKGRRMKNTFPYFFTV